MICDDRNLIARALGGEREAFAELVDRYRDAVCGVAYHYLGNFDDVQDAAQEAFLQAYSRLSQLRDPDKFGPWVRQLTANLCVDILRARDKSQVHLDQIEEPAGSADDQRKAAMRLVVRDALAKLSDKTRLTVTLCYINGYSHDEVAQFLEVPLNTVRSRLRIAKKQLREEMIEMVHDVLHEDKPGDELTQRIVSIFQEGMSAQQSGELQDSVRSIDDMILLFDSVNNQISPEEYKQALIEAVKKLEMKPKEEAFALAHFEAIHAEEFHLRIKAELLMNRADMLVHMHKNTEAAKYYEQSAMLAEQLGDMKTRAEALARLSSTFGCGSREALDALTETMNAFDDLGDTRGVAKCAYELGIHHLCLKDTAAALPFLHKAHDMYNSVHWTDAAVICRAALDLVDIIGNGLIAHTRAWLAACQVVQSKRDSLSGTLLETTGFSWREDPAFVLTPGTALYHVMCLGTFLRSDMTVGRHWSNNGIAGFPRASAKTIVDVTGIEAIDVPAGTFTDCILVKYVTTAKRTGAGGYDDQTMQRVFYGTRHAWYAPGVGLVQLQVTTGDGREGLIQLQDYHIVEPSKDHFPLAVGNTWTYTWPDMPSGLCGKEFYKVAERKKNEWYLEHYYYIRNNP